MPHETFSQNLQPIHQHECMNEHGSWDAMAFEWLVTHFEHGNQFLGNLLGLHIPLISERYLKQSKC